MPAASEDLVSRNCCFHAGATIGLHFLINVSDKTKLHMGPTTGALLCHFIFKTKTQVDQNHKGEPRWGPEANPGNYN